MYRQETAVRVKIREIRGMFMRTWPCVQSAVVTVSRKELFETPSRTRGPTRVGKPAHGKLACAGAAPIRATVTLSNDTVTQNVNYVIGNGL